MICSPGQLKAQLGELLLRYPHQKLVAWECDSAWQGPESIEARGKVFRVVQPRSVLELHRLVVEAEERGERLACLIDLDQASLDQDLLRRLPRHRLLRFEPWDLVRSRFKATAVDPWLARQHDLAPYLLEAEPADGFSPSPGGVLTSNHAWRYLLAHWFRLDAPGADPVEILLDAPSLMRWFLTGHRLSENVPGALWQCLRSWLHQREESLLALLVPVMRRGGGDLVPLGIVCEVLYLSEQPDSVQSAAAARLERWVDGLVVDGRAGRRWWLAAQTALQGAAWLAEESRAQILHRAEGLLAELGAESLARRSSFLPAGLEGGLELMAREVTRGSVSGALKEWERLQQLFRELAPARLERARMALRLAGWLAGYARDETPDLASRMELFLADGCWVDRARGLIYQGDPCPDVQHLYQDLFMQARARREQENLDFARALLRWQDAGADSPPLGVERFVDEVLAPLVRQTRVFLVVLDGMSAAVLTELLQERMGYSSRIPAEGPAALVAALPSHTEWSRTSLLSGKLVQGTQANEKEAFRQHPALVGACRREFPPVLYHKGDLFDARGGVKEELGRRLESEDFKLVGVVLNAIDDYLLRDDQLHVEWRFDRIKPLMNLLQHAQRADRAVLLVSDHGHVLEQGTSISSERGEGSRWCKAGEDLPGGFDLSGPRVQGKDWLWLAHCETVRLGNRQNGYHGGLTPQEVVCPLHLLVKPGRKLNGWVESAWQPPTWWSPELIPSPRLAAPSPGQGELFEPVAASGLVDQVLESALWRDQVRLLRLAPPELGQAVSLLRELEKYRRELPLTILEQLVPSARLGLLIERVIRLVNVDGFPVVTTDGRTVQLDPNLLARQFGLGELGTQIRLSNGRTMVFPLALKDNERLLMEQLGQQGRLSEAGAARILGTPRASGILADLSLRLSELGSGGLVEEGMGPEGRVYRLDG